MTALALENGKSAHVAYGLYAFTCALKAKTGQLTPDKIAGLFDRIDGWDITEMRPSAERFAAAVTADPDAAAEAFQDDLIAMGYDIAPVSAARAHDVLDVIEAEDGWRARVDING